MNISPDQARTEIVPVLERLFTDTSIGKDFAARGVQALQDAGISLSPAAKAYFSDVDLKAADEAIQAFQASSSGSIPASGPRALVIGFPVVALVVKGIQKPGQ